MVDLMNLEDQVEKDFTIARRRARLRELRRRILKRDTRGTLLSPDAVRRSVPLGGAMHRGLRTVETSRIVGSVGKHAQFDPCFMPLAKASPEKWKRIDRAFRRGQELPPVSLLKLREDYHVIDGHHRVSVARFHGAEWIDAEITEARSLPARRRPLDPQPAA
ncbi:MAG TPA: hypothetical protein VK869_04200 [Rubrobacteraceae bacterium]|nr:hypothetical protein [Rubrobacteraceae bacterium]